MRKLLLVRHGESTANVSEIISGDPKTPLTDLGVQQAVNTGKQIALKHDTSKLQIVASPYTRAHETAKHIAREIGHDPSSIITDHELRERHFGEFEGKHVDFNKVPGYIVKHGKTSQRANEHFRPVGGESLVDVRDRVVPAIQRHIAAHPDKQILVVAHGHVIKAVHGWHQGSWDKIPRAKNAELRELDLKEAHKGADALIAEALAGVEPIYVSCHLCHASVGTPCRFGLQPGEKYHDRRINIAKKGGYEGGTIDTEHALAHGAACKDDGGICSKCGQTVERLRNIPNLLQKEKA